jgi:hypothetical protein
MPTALILMNSEVVFLWAYRVSQLTALERGTSVGDVQLKKVRSLA